MVQYTLNISVADNWVDYFNTGGWQFCFARTTQSAGSVTTFNVIAVADTVAENIQVTWEDDYGMAGAMTGYSAGAEITISTNVLDINFGQEFLLQDWATYTVQDSSLAPQNGFLFSTVPSAAAVLYQTVQGQKVPVYITPQQMLPPSTNETLEPLVQVAVWFQLEVTSKTMVDQAMTNAFIIPMTTTTMSAEYDADGKWSTKTDKILYPPDDDDAIDSQGLSRDQRSLENHNTAESAEGRIFRGEINFGDTDPDAPVRKKIADSINASLLRWPIKPPFSVVGTESDDQFLYIFFSQSDKSGVLLALAKAVWTQAFDNLPDDLRNLGQDDGCEIAKTRDQNAAGFEALEVIAS